MVCDHIQVDRPHRVVGRDKAAFDVPGQVSAAQKPKISELKQQAQTGRIVSIVDIAFFMSIGIGVFRSTVGNDLAAGCQDGCGEFCLAGLQWNTVARGKWTGRVLAGRAVGGDAFFKRRIFLKAIGDTAIPECANTKFRGQHGMVTIIIPVPV